MELQVCIGIVRVFDYDVTCCCIVTEKDTIQFVTHVLYHFCDTNLIAACAIHLQCKISCCLHMYFLWRHHLPPDKSENDDDSDSD